MKRLVHSSKSPFEIFLLIAAVLSGLVGIVHPGAGGRIVSQLPHWGQYIWYGGLLGAGVITLVGVVTHRLWSLYVERGGLQMLGALSILYSAEILFAVPVAANSFSVVTVIGFSVACLVRVRQISRDIKQILTEDL